MNWKVKLLKEGKTIISKEPGNSMLPIIKSKQPVRLEPVKWGDCEVNDIVYCRVRGKLYTHLVKAKNDKKGLQIANNKGFINGWTKTVYGRVIEILN